MNSARPDCFGGSYSCLFVSIRGWKLRFHGLVLIAAFLCPPGKLFADVITDWNSLALRAIANETTSAPLAARNLAIVHTAIYEAVNEVDRRHEGFALCLNAPPGALPEAAAVAAAYHTLLHLYPSQQALFVAAFDEYLARTPADEKRLDGLIF